MKEHIKNLGKVVMTPKGAWSIEKEYEILDIVYDSITDHAYISKQEVPSGVDLSDSRYWMPLNVSGYSDSNVIALNSFNEDGEIQSYTLEKAIKAIKDVGRKSGAILIFYNDNVNRLDITTGCWEIWQFNSINVYDWENLDAWVNIYYNYNKFVGWYAAENVLNKEIPNPDVGCYAFVGNVYNEAFVYRCDIKNQWTKTNQKAQHYIKVVFGDNVIIGENGNWWQNGVDTNIPVSVKGDNGLTPYLRWSVNNQMEYSYDNINWYILSDKFNTNIKIKDYVTSIDNLPNNIELGTIYGVGPIYTEDDIEQINPIYNLYVYTSNGWINNGRFNSISAGIVQELGNSETEVVSQKAVTNALIDINDKTNKKLSFNLGNDFVFYENKVSSISSVDNYSALVDSETYDCFLIKVKENIDIKVSGANPAQYVFYSELPIKGTNIGYIKYNTSGKYISGAKYAIINFRHDENKNGYNNIEINTDYKINEVKQTLSWKVIYVDLASRIADEINSLPEGSYFFNTYSNTLGVRKGENGWEDHAFAKNELYIINDKAYYFNGSELKSLNGKNYNIDLSNKKWICFGDSLTEINNRTTKRYYDYIIDKTGINVVNMGLGGSGYKDEYDKNNAFYQRILNISTDFDLITIFGSGNDLSHTLGDVTDINTDTICGCINKTLDNLFSIYPLANVGIITPTPWGWYPPSDENNKMAKYSDALIEICKRRGIPYLDLYHCSGLRPWEESYLSLCYSKDDGNSVHPDEKGHEIIASKIQSFIETLLLH